MLEITLIIFCIAGLWYWQDSLAVRDTAIVLGRSLAERTQLQLLDETVACTHLSLGRNAKGHLQFLRTYQFEVSAQGTDRLDCELVLLGRELQSWHIPPYLQAVH